MTHYPIELKDSIIARMLPPNNISVPLLARETGIPKDTLYTWRSKAGRAQVPSQPSTRKELSSEERFDIVVETAGLNESELGEYCRRKGLFPQQIAVWQENCKQAHAPLTSPHDRKTIQAQKKEIKRLEGELMRKEKALAESAALLFLQKKVRSLWEESGDRNSTPVYAAG
jgi:transposase-like protein